MRRRGLPRADGRFRLGLGRARAPSPKADGVGTMVWTRARALSAYLDGLRDNFPFEFLVASG
jgi:hypothetical protein